MDGEGYLVKFGFPPIPNIAPPKWTARGKTVLNLAADTCRYFFIYVLSNLTHSGQNSKTLLAFTENYHFPPIIKRGAQYGDILHERQGKNLFMDFLGIKL